MAATPRNLVVISDTHCWLRVQRSSCRVSHCDGAFGSMEFSGPSTDAESVALKRDSDGPRRVLALLLIGGPSAIGWAIAGIVVDSFKRVLGCWAIAHIGQERWKRTTPPLAYGYASSTVSREESPVLVLAAADHSLPDAVFGGVALAVCGAYRVARIVIQTATTRGVAASQSARGYFCRLAAVAAALPVLLVVAFLGLCFHGQSSKPLSGQVHSHG